VHLNLNPTENYAAFLGFTSDKERLLGPNHVDVAVFRLGVFPDRASRLAHGAF
jgi:hypothetical protein